MSRLKPARRRPVTICATVSWLFASPWLTGAPARAEPAASAPTAVWLVPTGLGAEPSWQRRHKPRSGEPRASAWEICPAAARAVELRRGLPDGLLEALTLTETGRRSESGRTMEAWPWTINVAGKGYVFATRTEAVAAARRFLAEGRESVDVGCGQINLKYHPRAFESMEAAFDPLLNLDYAASLLERAHAKEASWPKAVARYHSGRRHHGARYARKVLSNWERIRAAATGPSATIASAD